MNIIELFEKLNLEKTADHQFSADEVIKIEKRINVEKKLNPEIDNNVASNLVLALKNYPEEFNFLANDFLLYNFFANTRHRRDDFWSKNIEPERIRNFISRFLEEELALYFDKKMSQNAFDDMDYLLKAKEYFPDDVLYKIEKKIHGKLDFTLNKLAVSEVSDLDSVFFLKQKSFYDLLSKFSSPEMDERVSLLINSIVEIYNATKKSGFGESAMLSISNYDAFDSDLNDLLAKNREAVRSNIDNTSSGSSGISGRTIFFIILVVLKLIWAMSKCSSNDSNTIYQNSYDNGIYNYGVSPLPNYESRSSYVDSVFDGERERITSFKYYLVTKFPEQSAKENFKKGNFKTGDNPFTNVFGTAKTSDLESREIVFKNNTKFDVVVLENAVKYTNSGRKNNFASRAYFIKSNESLPIKIDEKEEKVFNFYAGNTLSSFGSDAEFQIFDAMSEYRFQSLPENATEIITEDYFFSNDVELKQEGKKIKVVSKKMSLREEPVEYVKTMSAE